MKSYATYKLFIIVFLSFIFITFLYFPTLFMGFSKMVETNDGRFVAWCLSWDIHKLLTDPVHIFQANIFYPNPNTLSYSEHFIGTSMLGIPVWLISGGNPAATFNFLMILGYVVNAFFSFLLIRKLVKNNAASFLGAFINGFCSYRLWNIGHLQNIFIFYIPLSLWFFYKFLENRKWKYLLGISICVLMQSLSSWYHMIFLVLLLAIIVLYYFIIDRELTKKDFFKMLITIAAPCLLIIPAALPYLVQNQQSQSAYSMSDILSSDLGGYFLAPPATFLNGVFNNYFGITKSRWLENFNFIGYTPMLLCLFSLFRFYTNHENRNALEVRKETRAYLIIAIIFFILSLGPYFIFNDKQTGLKLPYFAIFKSLSPIRFLRCVARYATVVLLMTAIITSFGIANLLLNKSKKTKWLLSILIFLLFVVEFTPIEKFNRFTDMSNVPQVYYEIKKDSSIKAMVELPFNVGPFTTTRYLYYGGIHFKPLVNGYSGYEPQSYINYRNLFEDTVSEFANTVATALGVTHYLSDPDYHFPMDSNYFNVVFEKEGYKLYKIKKSIYSSFVEDIGFNTKQIQSNDSSFRLTRTYNDILFNPPTPYTFFANISADTINKSGFINYISNKPLNKLYLQFRTYAPTDTLEIQCFKTGSNGINSLIKAYTYSNNSSFLNKPEALNLENAREVRIRLYSSVFTDRTFIRNLVFLADK